MTNYKRKTKKTTSRAATQKAGSTGAYGVSLGVLGVLLALWLIYNTITLTPFSWGIFAEEIILSLCAVFALRLLGMANPADWVPVACLILLPAGIIIYGATAAARSGADFSRFLCLAGTAASMLLTARQLDAKPDGTLFCALLFAAALPVLVSAETMFIEELMRLLLTAGVLAAVFAVKEKLAWLAFLAAGLFGVSGAAGFYAAFFGAGAAVGLMLSAPKKDRSAWVFAAVLMAGLPLAARLFAGERLPQSAALFAENTLTPGVLAAAVNTHFIRIFAVGLLLLAIRFFAGREDAAAVPLLALVGAALFRLLSRASGADAWMDAPTLVCLAGVGIAKFVRPKGR
ncbi:MAG TPA: hypothetical protein VN453_06260 [Feifaniaceae bacterium]|nr:hypothetical protein [Feifaniaceae bacterium]